MKSLIIPVALVFVVLSSCSTVYRSGQTPDDVYYSPARQTEEYVRVENEDQPRYRTSDRYSDFDNSDDRWLRMRVRNRSRWSAFDEYDWNDYRYNSLGYNSYYPGNYNSPWNNNYWNNYYSWNSFYNPYCPRVIIVNPKTNPAAYNKVRNFSLQGYANNNYNNKNTPRTTGVKGFSNSGYNNNNSSKPNFGTSVRKVFSDNNSSSSDRPTRTYNPSSSSSNRVTPSSSNSSPSSSSSSGGSSGSSSSGSSGGSRPTRGGN